MSNVFIDSNIWIYAFVEIKAKNEKRKDVLDLLNGIWKKDKIVVSVQVLNEFHWVLKRRYNISELEIRSKVKNGIVKVSEVVSLTQKTYEMSYSVRDNYNVSYWDSLIIASALDNNCSILYTEDMQDGHVIENGLRIVNPFDQKRTEVG